MSALFVVLAVMAFFGLVCAVGSFHDKGKARLARYNAQQRAVSSNVVVLDARRPGSNVRPLPQRRWPA